VELARLLEPRRRDPPAQATGDVQALAHPDWLWHRLTVSGDIDQLWAFQRAAAGAGVTPWVHDDDAVEEQLVSAMLLQPRRTVSLAGVKIIARQLRDSCRPTAPSAPTPATTCPRTAGDSSPRRKSRPRTRGTRVRSRTTYGRSPRSQRSVWPAPAG